MLTPAQLSLSSHQNGYEPLTHPILPEQLSRTASPSSIQIPLRAVSSSMTPYRDRALSIDTICLSIFAFLPLSDAVKNMCYVNKKWRNLTLDEMNFWLARCPHGVRYVFTSSIIGNLRSWKDVYLYARLFSFTASIIESRHASPDFITLKNPKIEIPHPFSHLNHIMPKPFVPYGDYHFTICNQTDIEVNKGENSKFFLQQGKNEKMLTHLSVEDDCVFALDQEGNIFQWNYKEKIMVNKFSTAYFTRNKKLKQGVVSNRPFCDKFYIKNGLILIAYAKDCRILKRSLEIIPYEDPKKFQLIEDFPLVSNLIFMDVLEDQQIIIMGNDFRSQHAIWKMKFPGHETDMLSTPHHSSWTALSQHSLEKMTDTSRIFSIIDLNTGKVAYSAESLEHIYMVETCVVIENLVFSFFFMSEKLYVDVIRIDRESACRVARLEESFVPLHSEYPIWWIDFHKRLLSIAKEELNGFIPLALALPRPKRQFKSPPKPQLKPKPKRCVIA